MSLIKSKQRVVDHGEVFTPSWLVDAMLDLVKDESDRLDARFLEPACGSGNFLTKILMRKLATVELKYSKSEFDRQHYAILSLMCIYGIEILEDNIAECKVNLLDIFSEYLNLNKGDALYACGDTKLEPDLFLTVTGLTVKDFHLLVQLRVFNTEHMNQAVFAFRRYEDASLRYTGIDSHEGLSRYGLFNTVVAIEG